MSQLSVPYVAFPEQVSKLKTELMQAFENVLVSGQYVLGEKGKLFEKEFSAFCNAKYAIGVANGTDALHLTLKCIGVEPGDEVITAPNSFIASAGSIGVLGAKPVFVDVESDMNMDPNQLEKVITPRTKAIMPVHIAGNPADLDKICAIGKKHGIAIVEDAAQAHGSEWNGKKVGAIGLGGIFSFQTSKNMSAGEGGAIITNDDDFKEACFSYHNCGRVSGGEWYEHQHLGGNFRLNALAASMLMPQLDSIGTDMDLRDTNKQRLDDTLAEIDGIELTGSYEQTTRSAQHLYIVKYKKDAFNGIHRDVFFKAMQVEGVYTYAGYSPLYREKLFVTDPDEYPWLKNRDYASLSLPVTERICDEESVWLQQRHLLGNEDDIQDIVDAFIKVTTALKNEPELFR